MNIIDAIRGVSELVSWVSLAIGIPAVLIAVTVKAIDGRWHPVEIVVITIGDQSRALWYAGSDFQERLLTDGEAARCGSQDPVVAFVSERRPGLMRLDPYRAGVRALHVIGMTFSITGATTALIGFALLFVP